MTIARFVLHLFLSIIPFSLAAEAGAGESDGQSELLVIDMGEESSADIYDEALSEAIWKLIESESKKSAVLVVDRDKMDKTEPVAAAHHGKFLGHPRDYLGGVTTYESERIGFIVTTLATKSLITIARSRSDLETAGDQIDHVHPLNFLKVVFTSEELKVGIRNIRTRGWIWSDFLAGIKKSLTTEASHGNMGPDVVSHFANSLKINPQILLPAAAKGDWEDFVNLLIATVPRGGDHGRFDS